MKTTRTEHTSGQRLFALLLAALLVFGMVPVTGVADTATTGNGIDTWADPQTLTRPEMIYGDNTMNAGKVTVGKSVSTSSVTVNGQTVTLDDPDNFLVTISQSAQVMGLSSETSIPVDVVFVLDTSGSMGYNNTTNKTGRAEAMVNAANNAISTLLAANEYNRVSVVAFSSEGYGGGTSDDDAANLLSPLYHYEGTAATKHLQWVSDNNRTYNGSTTNTTSTSFGVGSNYYLIAGRTTNGNVGNTRDGGNGGTNIHAGIALGAQQLMNVTDTTVTYEDGTTVTRMPFIILLSDGAPTFSSSTQNWYNPSQTAEQGPGNDDYTGNGFLAALTAAYYKGAITNHYYGANADNNNRCSIYTIGVSVGNDTLANLTLNPKANFNANANSQNHGGRFASYWRSYNNNNQNNGFTVNVDDDENFRITNASISATKNYVSGKNANGTVMYTEGAGITYNDGYYSASQTNQIAGIFEQVVTEISKKAISAPTHVGTHGQDFSGYVTFTDPLGEYMEVKDMKGIVANGHYYRGASAAQYLASGSNGEFNTLIAEVLQTRMHMTASTKITAQELLAAASASTNQAYYNSATDYDNSIVWWGSEYHSGEEDTGMQVVGFADNDTIEYITAQQAAGTIPADADYVCRSYFFYGTAGGTVVNANHEYLYFVIRVQRSLTAPYQQTVVISAPASLLSMEKVLITEESDGTFTASVEEADPARVVYEVGLQDGITAETVASMVDSSYTGENVNGGGQVNYDPTTDTYYFFTNDWDRTESLDSHHRAQAKATFDAAADNAFYTYQEDTLVVDASGNAVTANPAGTTAYYVREYYDWTNVSANSDGTYTATKKTALIQVDIPAGAALVQKDGKYYIPKGAYTGATLVVNGDDTTKITNVTGTSAVVAHPHRTGDASNSHYTVLLGNNGVLALTAVDTKFVANVTQNITNADGKAVMVGDILTYTINVRNTENAVADAVVTDTIPVGTELVAGSISHSGTASGNKITWNLENLAAGSTTTVSFQVKVTEAALDDAVISIDNTATIQIGNNPAYNTNTTKNPPEGKLVYDANDQPVGEVEVGQTLSYFIEYTNDQASASTITITDKIPTGTTYVDGTATHGGVYDATTKTITWTLTNVGAGVSGMVSFDVLVNVTAVEKVENQATIKVGTNDPKQTNKTTTTLLTGDLRLSKTVVIPTGLTPAADTFTLTLTEAGSVMGGVTLNGKFKVEGSSFVTEVEFVNGVATLQIKDGDTITVKGLPSGAVITVTETVPAGFAANITGTGIRVTVDDQTTASAAVTNTYAVTPVTVTLEGNKKLTGTTPESETFGFTAVPCNASGVPTGAAGVTGEAILNSGEKTISFGTLTFTAPGTYYYLISEVNSGDRGMTYDATQYLVTITVTDNGAGVLTAATALASRAGNSGAFTPVTSGDEAVFTNVYQPLPTSITLEGSKILTGRDLKDGEFSFLVTENGSIVSTGTNRADVNGSIEFRPITYSAPGSHTYTITEVKGGKHGVTYSTESYTVTVNVVDDNGQLKATATYPDGGVKFTNTFTPTDVTLTLSGTKTLTGAGLTAEAFAFVVKNGTTVVATGNNLANGSIVFSPIVYTRAMLGEDNTETFTYQVTELKPDMGADPNLYYDPAVYTVTVTVTYDPATGIMTVGTPTYTKDGSSVAAISFANIQNPATVTVTPDGKKATDGNLPDGIMFSFSVTELNGTLVASGTSGKEGTITFPGITYDSDDLGNASSKVFRYWITEDRGGTEAAGISYDGTKYLMKVTLSRNATNKLVANKEYFKLTSGDANDAANYTTAVNAADVAFNNKYTVQGTSVEINAIKVLTGRDLKQGEFAFGLYHINNGVETLVDTANNVARDSVGGYNDIYFIRSYDESVLGGQNSVQIKYVIRELDNGIHGVDYSEAVPVYVLVTVADNGSGGMNKTVQYYSDKDFTNEITASDVKFTNHYTPDDVTINLEAFKELTGANPTADAFAFVVKDAGGNVVATGNNGHDDNGDGQVLNDELKHVVFSDLVYSIDEMAGVPAVSGIKTKELQYTIDELEPSVGRDPNLYYDPAIFNITVTLTYNEGTGEFTAAVSYPVDRTFNNVQNPASVEVIPVGSKTTDNEPAVLSFSFTVEQVNADGTGANIVAGGTSPADGTINFSALTYTDADVGKTYYYWIYESNHAGQEVHGVTYSGKRYLMVVSIARDGSNYNALKADVTYYDAGVVGSTTTPASVIGNNSPLANPAQDVTFHNVYNAKGTMELQAVKNLQTEVDRDLKAHEFLFVLERLDASGNVVSTRYATNGYDKNSNGTIEGDEINAIYFPTLIFSDSDVNANPTGIVYRIREINNGIAGMTYATNEFYVHVTLVHNLNGTVTATPTYYTDKNLTNSVGAMTFTNEYNVTDTFAEIEAFKFLTGRDPLDGEFSFGLYHIDGGVETLVDTANNVNHDGIKGFNEIYFIRHYAPSVMNGIAGNTRVIQYVIRELNNGIHGVNYDDALAKPVYVQVTITHNDNGTLSSSVVYSYAADFSTTITDPSFTNHYTPDDISVTLEGIKSLVDDQGNSLTMNGDEFAFVVKNGDTVVATGNNAADGTITFSPIVYKFSDMDNVTAVDGVKTKIFTYTIDELEPDTGKDPNLYYDPATFTVTVTVTYNESTGEFKVANVAYPTDGVKFNNIQNPAIVTVTPEGSKATSGNFPAGVKFSFSVLDASGNTVAAGISDPNGKINFSNIPYDSDDLGTEESVKFHYWIVEDNAGTVHAGIHYDATKYLMVVTLSRNETNKLITDVKYFSLKEGGNADTVADYDVPVEAANVKFTNVYKVTEGTSAKIFANKILNGRKLQSGEFSFGLYHVNNGVETLVDTATNTDYDNDGIFDEIYFIRSYAAGVIAENDLDHDYEIDIEYVIKELNNNLGGVDYSDAEAKPIYVKVNVKDNRDGTMTAKVTYSYGSDFSETVLSFTNTYNAQGTVFTPAANKALNGRHQSNDEFSFVVTDLSNDQVVSTGLSKAANSGDARAIVFTPVSYSFADLLGAPVVNGKPTKVFTYSISEVPGNLTNVAYTNVVYYVMVTVTDNLDGTMTATPVYYTDAACTQQVNGTVTFVNGYTPIGTTIHLEATKTLTGRDAVDGEFSFVVKNAAGDVVATGGNYGDKVQFSGISFNVADMEGADSKTFTFTMEELASSQGGMTFDTTKYTVEIEVTNNLTTGQLEVTKVTYKKGTETVDAAVFTNAYNTQLDVILAAEKTLVGKTLVEGEFKFELRNANNKVIAQTVNAADGSIRFPFLYTEEDLKDVTADANGVRTKTFTYSINEVDGSGTAAEKGTYTYDPAVYDVTVVLTDDGNGNLDATVTYTKRSMTRMVQTVGSAEFINYYTPNAITNWELPVTAEKVVETPDNSGYEMDTFHFQITNTVGEVVATGVNDATGKITFNPTITLSNAGWYYFRITETPDAEPIPGITYDATVWEVHVYVSFNEATGELHVDQNNIHIYKLDQMERASFEKVVFTNTYSPAPTDLTIKIFKSLTGRDLMAGEFAFHIGRETAVGDLIEVESRNDAEGWVTFHLSYTEAGTYEYVIHEVKPETPLGGVAYDGSVYHATVVVTDDGSGQLEVTSKTVTDSNGKSVQDVVFTNVYTAESVDVNIEAVKLLDGRTMKPGEFSFTLTDEKGNVKQAVNDADGKVTFEIPAFDRVGVYTYTVAEVKGSAQGMTYDETKYTVTITVTDNGMGNLVADVVYTKGTEQVSALVFTNTYKGLSTFVDVTAKKVLEGKDLTAGAYTFTLVNKDNPDEVYTAVNAQDGTICFEDIPFSAVGTYTYLMSEVKGSDSKTAYDDTVYTVTITVTDTLQGSLKAEVDFGGKTAVFTNVYTPDAINVPLKGNKELTGRDQVAGEFAFEVRDELGNLITTGTNTADGTIIFEDIEVYGAGEAVLYVSEVAGDAERMTYDDYTYRVKLVVTNNNGVLEATVTYLDGDIVFYNEYKDVPLTGDDTPVGLYAGLLGTSLLAMAAVLVLYRKKETV